MGIVYLILKQNIKTNTFFRIRFESFIEHFLN